MGKKCFAPRCKTGHKSYTDKLSLFSAPREEERLRVWRNAIPRKDRILQSTDHLCEWHFEPHLLLPDPPESGATASDVLLHDCTSAPLAAVSNFDELFGSPASVELPSTTWGFHRLQVDELRNVVFSELRRVREPQCTADTSHIVPWKLLDINQDMQLSVVLMGRPVSPEVLGSDLEVSTINDITTLLKHLENLHLCGGGPTANEYPRAQLECALVDVCG
ncbi:hypothetical protein MRX96_056945 [Rhipicephalus microplus]